MACLDVGSRCGVFDHVVLERCREKLYEETRQARVCKHMLAA